ncbi:MAG: hypothetical protein JJT82_00775, partial [Legionellaceae bacterium]|nr:hypothetical protein [Legionellaceae bacterium]
MTIQDLKNLALQCLQALSPVEPERLRERVLVTHTQRVINKLLDILAKAEIAPDHVLADLEKLLAQNWQDTQRTMLCYTAIPESDMTRLFIKTAEFVAQSRNSKPQNPEDSSRRPTGVIELLMPGVCTESLSPSYPDLGPYQDLAADKTLLWKNPEVDIQKLLVSHVLGTGSYLIPVQLLTELEANGQVRLDNPYFDYKGHAAKHSTLQPAELERLYHHSPETRALKEAYDTCKALTEDK